MNKVKGSCCLVTGASDPTSIGYACVQALMDAGAAQVTILARNPDNINATIASSSSSTQLHGVTADMHQPDTMEAAVNQAVEKMGGSLDILIVSGGNGSSEYLGLPCSDLDSYRTAYETSVLSPMALTHATVKHMQQRGSIVHVTSMASRIPWPNTAPYNMAKAAQHCMIQNLAFEYREKGVTINAVLPACIHTGQLDRMATKKDVPVEEYAQLRGAAHPLGRNGTPAEVAQAVLSLATNPFVTGELLQVDGGLHLSNWFNRPRLLNEYQGK